MGLTQKFQANPGKKVPSKGPTESRGPVSNFLLLLKKKSSCAYVFGVDFEYVRKIQ